MAYKNKKIIAVMPAYNAAKTLEKTYKDLPADIIDGVLLIDDFSSDNTIEIANKLGIKVIAHPKNRGYGGNQKTCYKAAVEMGADIVVMVHPDHQYDPKFIPEMIKLMADEDCLAVFGSRMKIRENALKGGMPKWKYFFNIILTKIGNFMLETNLTEFHSGFRAYDTRIFKIIDIEKNSDNFVFDTQIIIQLVSRGVKIKEIPISTRYFKEASQIKFKACIVYGVSLLYNLFIYRFRLKKF